jgi:hypothetical protein
MTLKAIPNPPFLSTFNPMGGGSGIRHTTSQQPRSKCPDQRRSRDPILLSCSMFNQCGPFPPLCHLPEPPFPYCRVSSVLLHSLVRVVLSPSHHPLTTRHVSHSPPRQPPTKLCPSRLLFCLLCLSPFSMCLPCNLSRSLISSFLTLIALTPLFPSFTPFFALASTSIHQAIQLIQVAAQRAVHVPKVPSWLDHPQSQGSSY